MGSENRISPVSTATAADAPAKAPWWNSPIARRIAVALIGAGLGAACPFLPWAPAQAVCRAVTDAIVQVERAASSVDPHGPPSHAP